MARAVTLKQRGEIVAAWDCLSRALPMVPAPRPLGVHLLEAGLAARMGWAARAEAAARAAVEVAQGSDRELARYALGSLLATMGRVEEAGRLFAEDHAVPLGHGGTVRTGAIRLLTPGMGPLPDAPLHFARRMGPARGAPPDPSFPLLFAAGDSRYLARFGPAYAAAAARQGLGVQMHVVNPEPALEPVLTDLSAQALLTCEHSALQGWDERARRAYYSCARLLLLPDLLERHAGPVIMTDLDQLLLRDPASALPGEEDVALLMLPGNECNFFSYVSATLAVFRPGPGARRFATTAAGLLRASLADGPPQWHTDQAVLAATLLGGHGFAWGRLDPALVHLDEDEPPPGGPACFWSITASLATNARKEQAPAFRAFLARGPARPDELTRPDGQG